MTPAQLGPPASGTTATGGVSLATVSVVVIGRNEGELLVRSLAAVNAMDYPAELLERIYVDSESTDESTERATDAGFQVLSYGSESRTAAGARDLGWRAARSRLVLFLDGDCAVDSNFLRRAVSEGLAKGAGVVAGRVRERTVYGNVARQSVVRRLLGIHFEVNHRQTPGWGFYPGGCVLVERAGLEEVDGFNTDLAATENIDLGRRLLESGRRVWVIDHLIAEHDSGCDTWRDLFRRNLRNGYWFELYQRRLRTAHDTVPRRLHGGAPETIGMKAAGVLAAAVVGGPIAGALAAAVLGGLSVRKRQRKIQLARGSGRVRVADAALLTVYDLAILRGRLRGCAELAMGRPGALRVGTDWRSA